MRKKQVTTENRNYGIDILRIVSMLLIVVMHTLKQGGVLEAANDLRIHFQVAWLLEVMAFCAVDCYALISGYVGVTSKFKPSRVVRLWLQVVFYTLLITLIFQIFFPTELNYKFWLKAIFPIISRQYWYVSSYFGMLVFVPVLNEGIRALSAKQLRLITAMAVLLFSVLPILLQGYPFNFDPNADYFGLLNGYSVLWLLVLYLVGAYLRISDLAVRVKTWRNILTVVVCVVITWGAFVYLPDITTKRFGEVRYATNLLVYTSPTILLTAASLLMMFRKINCGKGILRKAVEVLSPATLGVYLIHVHPLIWDRYMKDYAVSFVQGNVLAMAGKVLLASCVIYLACSGIDIARGWLFRLPWFRIVFDRVDRLLD